MSKTYQIFVERKFKLETNETKLNKFISLFMRERNGKYLQGKPDTFKEIKCEIALIHLQRMLKLGKTYSGDCKGN